MRISKKGNIPAAPNNSLVLVRRLDYFCPTPSGIMSAVTGRGCPRGGGSSFFADGRGTHDPNICPGFMDYFGVIPLTTQDRGLRNAYIRLVSSPIPAPTLSLRVHDFAFAESPGGESSVGQEIDVVWMWR
jgi:hypothetical protein